MIYLIHFPPNDVKESKLILIPPLDHDNRDGVSCHCPGWHQTRRHTELSCYWAVSLAGCETCALVQTCAWYIGATTLHLQPSFMTYYCLQNKFAFQNNNIFQTISLCHWNQFDFQALFAFFPGFILQKYNWWYWFEGMVPGSTRLYLTVQLYTGGVYVHLYTGKLLDHTLIEICGCCPHCPAQAVHCEKFWAAFYVLKYIFLWLNAMIIMLLK